MPRWGANGSIAAADAVAYSQEVGMARLPGSFDRIPLIARCWMRDSRGAQEGLLCNLSVLGVYVTVERPPAEGETVLLRFLLPDGERPIECDVEITWQNPEPPLAVDSLPPGCGVRFTQMVPWDRQRIEALVADYRHALQPRIERPRPRSGFTRIPYVQPCLVTTATGSSRGVVCNLSALGLYAAIDPIPPFGERVRVTFSLPRAPEPLEQDCEVAWINPDEPLEVESLPTGCGLRFIDLEEDTRLRIERLTEEYLTLPRDVE
jgi:Tfp pilus assembly protein PilZ